MTGCPDHGLTRPPGPDLRRALFSTFLGNRFYFCDPRIDDVDIEDIAHGLAFPSAARCAPARCGQDYLGDMVKPLKQCFPEFAAIEAKVMVITGQRFSVGTFDASAIKRADPMVS